MPKFFCMPFFACNRQVDSLDKRQCNLTTLPHDIERYSRTLEELLLDMNHIKELPRSLFRLHKLQRLGLSDNDVYRIPPEIAQLQNLIELNVSRNDVSDIPDELKSCKMLKILDISSNPIARLPDSITQVSSLTHLNLNDTSLTKLPQDLGNLCNLKSLEVRENHLHTLPTSLSMLIHLQRLDVGQNELDELPREISFLVSLQEFYCDENHLEEIPDGILKCKNLEQMDLSSNKLMKLPENLGELEKLTDLTISQNCLQTLPSSIRHLKRLANLKADNNNLTTLTQAIGSCTNLVELYLMHNLLHEIPSTISNLKKLETFNIDKNQLTTIPPLIGQCENLAVLSMRDNQIMEIPMEIGKLANLRVLDLCNNQLRYLPFTINVLHKLQALWLSENQSQAMLKFQQIQDPITQHRVLTCYLLPQQQGTIDHDKISASSTTNKAFIGGPKVHFGGMEGDTTVDEEGGNTSSGNFSRHDTPHPKPAQGGKIKKSSIDGHVIHHEGGEQHPTNIMLSKKSIDEKQPLLPPSQQQQNGPRSALKHPPVAQPFVESPTMETNGISKADISTFSNNSSTTNGSKQRNVLFQTPNTSTSNTLPEESNEPRLRRINTPHYKSLRNSDSSGTQRPKGEINPHHQQHHQHPPQITSIRPSVITTQSLHQQDPSITTSTISSTISQLSQPIQQQPQLLHHPQPPSELGLIQREIKKIIIQRNSNTKGLGLTIAGGLESTPYIENDCGLFVSKLTPDGSAELSGLKVGDKLIEVNGVNMINQRHDIAVQSMKKPTDIVTMIIERQNIIPSTPKATGTTFSQPSSSQSSIIQQQPTTSYQSSTVSSTPPIKALSSEIRSGTSPSTSLETSTIIGNNNNNVISTHISKDSQGSPGFSISQPDGMDTVITAIKPGGAADRDGKLRVGDTILSINGQSCRGLTLNQISSQLTNPKVEAFVVLQRKSATSTPDTTMNGILNISQLPYGDTSVDGLIDTIELTRDENHSLGLSIVGGIDHCSHPFGINNPGIFVSKIATNSPAALCGRLRIGDRILSVNKETVEKATHADAIKALKNSGKHLVLTIRHEPQPKGLQEVFFSRRPNQPIGLNICGGIHSPPANINDLTDEGIFIEKIEHGSIADNCGKLCPGMRILEINDDSLLGCKQIEAANLFRKAEGTIRMLVCDGFNISDNNTTIDSQQSFPIQKTTLESRYVNINGNSSSSQIITSIPPKVSQILKESSPTTFNFSDFGPLSSSSPIPVTSHTINSNGTTTNGFHRYNNNNNIISSPNTSFSVENSIISNNNNNKNNNNNSSSINNSLPSSPATTFSTTSRPGGPPPVAPKPKVIPIETPESPENLNFSLKLRRFESEIASKTHTTSSAINGTKNGLSTSALPSATASSPIDSSTPTIIAPSVISVNGIKETNDSESAKTSTTTLPQVIRTKNAENRLAAASPTLGSNNSPSPSPAFISGGEPLNTVEQHDLEIKKRAEWRQARLASLDAETLRADQLMKQLSAKRLGHISEERSMTSSPTSNNRVLHNESSVENFSTVDKTNGEKTITIVETSVTQREV
jgi:protein scribble